MFLLFAASVLSPYPPSLALVAFWLLLYLGAGKWVIFEPSLFLF